MSCRALGRVSASAASTSLPETERTKMRPLQAKATRPIQSRKRARRLRQLRSRCGWRGARCRRRRRRRGRSRCCRLRRGRWGGRGAVAAAGRGGTYRHHPGRQHVEFTKVVRVVAGFALESAGDLHPAAEHRIGDLALFPGYRASVHRHRSRPCTLPLVRCQRALFSGAPTRTCPSVRRAPHCHEPDIPPRSPVPLWSCGSRLPSRRCAYAGSTATTPKAKTATVTP